MTCANSSGNTCSPTSPLAIPMIVFKPLAFVSAIVGSNKPARFESSMNDTSKPRLLRYVRSLLLRSFLNLIRALSLILAAVWFDTFTINFPSLFCGTPTKSEFDSLNETAFEYASVALSNSTLAPLSVIIPALNNLS